MRILTKDGSGIIFWGMTVLISSGLIDDASGQEWGSIREKVKDSIVFIEATKQKRDGTDRDVSTSTGFIVSKQGHLITVAHAVPRPDEDEIVSYRASVRTKHDQKYEIQLITRDDNLDLALLLLPQIGRVWHPLEFINESSTVPEDARLYILGFPLGLDLSSGDGMLSNYNGPGGKWQTTLPLNFGNSGGPVFDIGGRVVGVAAGGFDQARSITYIIPADYVRPLRSLVASPQANSMDVKSPKMSGSDINEAFNFSVTVDHEEHRNVEEEYCLPEGAKVISATVSISSEAGNGTHLISYNPKHDRPNCVLLKMFVAGKGVDRLGGIVLNYRGRGWLAGQLNVKGKSQPQIHEGL